MENFAYEGETMAANEVDKQLPSVKHWYMIPGGSSGFYQSDGLTFDVGSSVMFGFSDKVVAKLHDILRPFLLRRMKEDVEQMLPRKKEIILYPTMTEHQRNFQDHLVNKTLEGYFMEKVAIVGAEAEDDWIEFLLSEVKGKNITELISSGREKLASVPSGGGGVVAVAAPGGSGAATAAPAAAEAKKEEKVEEKEESDDMGQEEIYKC